MSPAVARPAVQGGHRAAHVAVPAVPFAAVVAAGAVQPGGAGSHAPLCPQTAVGCAADTSNMGAWMAHVPRHCGLGPGPVWGPAPSCPSRAGLPAPMLAADAAHPLPAPPAVLQATLCLCPHWEARSQRGRARCTVRCGHSAARPHRRMAASFATPLLLPMPLLSMWLQCAANGGSHRLLRVLLSLLQFCCPQYHILCAALCCRRAVRCALVQLAAQCFSQ